MKWHFGFLKQADVSQNVLQGFLLISSGLILGSIFGRLDLNELHHYKEYTSWVTTIAQWIRLRQPSYGAGFESQAQYLCFPFCNLNLNCIVKRTKVDKKMPRLAHRYLKKKGIERSKRIKLKRKDEHLRWKVAHWSSIRSWER